MRKKKRVRVRPIRSRLRRRVHKRMRRSAKTMQLPLLSVIIPAQNEGRRIAQVIREAKRIIPRTEVIVVSNGSTDGTSTKARRSGATVIYYKEKLGHDVGRAVGAKVARGEVLLFIDGDFVIRASQLRPYYRFIRQGYDGALNAYSGFVTSRKIHPTSEAKRLLNFLAGNTRLRGSSLTTVPHALSKSAIEKIGYEKLAIPPLAQARAIELGLRFVRAPLVKVAKLNPSKPRRELVKQLIIADHAEARFVSASLTSFNIFCENVML